ncbi:uncharacterized protein ACNLHF_008225 isoform 1-T2 [Anomaloglossus baeobatrachus]|uniref:uncharacterized protein LOC142291737 n=1 Tax=Anomaloglossus baeobatrachus TaxID=238106 RepID=UPI003F50A4DE
MQDIVVKQADKGGNVGIWPTVKYEAEAFRQLNNRDCYRKLDSNPSAIFKSELDNILKKACNDNIIPVGILEGLVNQFPIVPTIYFLPEVHKSLQDTLGRPIVSGVNSLCEPACRFLDYYLQPLMFDLPSYIRDSADLLVRIQDLHLDDDVIMMTADVESLYTSIAHSDGLRAVEFYLSTTSLESNLVFLLLTLLKCILTHNFFLFKGRYYLQQRGTAMGASCAPSYACLFLGYWERSIQYPDSDSGSVLLWVRYIDDVFMVWQGGQEELERFMCSLNVNNSNIKLTYNCSPSSIEFLDIRIMRGVDGSLVTDIFRKGTAVNSLLSAKSSHPPQVINSIPTGQFLRARRVCSDNVLFEGQAADLRRRFKSRHYSDRSIESGYERARHTPRDNLLKPSVRRSDQKVRFITAYHSQWREMNEVVARYWPILMSDGDLAKAISAWPSVTPRRSKTIKDMIVKSHYVPPPSTFLRLTRGPKWGSFACGDCGACPQMERSFTFHDASNTKSYKIVHTINCRTTFVVYWAKCPCGLIYVGLTSREFRVRVLKHIRDIKKAAKVETAEEIDALNNIPRHFWEKHSCNWRLLKFRGIDTVYFGTRGGDHRKVLAQKEVKWITTLETVKPQGLNDLVSFKPFL